MSELGNEYRGFQRKGLRLQACPPCPLRAAGLLLRFPCPCSQLCRATTWGLPAAGRWAWGCSPGERVPPAPGRLLPEPSVSGGQAACGFVAAQAVPPHPPRPGRQSRVSALLCWAALGLLLPWLLPLRCPRAVLDASPASHVSGRLCPSRGHSQPCWRAVQSTAFTPGGCFRPTQGAS